MRGSDFIFDFVDLLYYKCHNINLNRCRSYVDSPNWINNKKEQKILSIKYNNKYFQYAVTVVSNHKEIGKYPERIPRIKPSIDKYDWERINYPSEKDDWKNNREK